MGSADMWAMWAVIAAMIFGIVMWWYASWRRQADRAEKRTEVEAAQLAVEQRLAEVRSATDRPRRHCSQMVSRIRPELPNPNALLPYKRKLEIIEEFLRRLEGLAAPARELRATRRRQGDAMSFEELEEHRLRLVHLRADVEALDAEWKNLCRTKL